MNIVIAHLYPKLMNIYSDIGNIICLKKRCQWRGIEVRVAPVDINQKFDWQKYDLVFGGGGQDRQQEIVSKDLQKKKKEICQAVEQGMPMLTTCGTYQLFGHYFKTHQGIKIPGISIFDAYTIASRQRKIGNIVIELNNLTKKQFNNETMKLVGFENHSGNTYLKEGETKSLGKVIKGFGNNGKDCLEVAVYQNVIGTYLHGPILPKNPHLAEYLILSALQSKYGKKTILKPLDDTLDLHTHSKAIERTHQAKNSFF